MLHKNGYSVKKNITADTSADKWEGRFIIFSIRFFFMKFVVLHIKIIGDKKKTFKFVSSINDKHIYI